MYLVEIETGREALYESVDALSAAIRRGDVGPQSRIFHRASSSWISITLHPEFRKVADAAHADAAHADAAHADAAHAEPLPPLARNRWTFFGLDAKSREIHEPAAPAAEVGQPAEVRSESSGGGLRALLSRAFRGLYPSPKASETPGS